MLSKFQHRHIPSLKNWTFEDTNVTNLGHAATRNQHRNKKTIFKNEFNLYTPDCLTASFHAHNSCDIYL